MNGAAVDALTSFSKQTFYAEIERRDGLVSFLQTQGEEQIFIWKCLMLRDFSPKPSPKDAIAPFNTLRAAHIQKSVYINASEMDRYLQLSILNDIHWYLMWKCAYPVALLLTFRKIDRTELEAFNSLPINNPQQYHISALVPHLTRCENLFEQWDHAIKFLVKQERQPSAVITVLMAAIYRIDLEFIDIMLRYGTDVNVTLNIRNHQTAMSFALYYRIAPAANLILSYCPGMMRDVNLLDEQTDREPIFTWAAKHNHTKIMEYLLRHGVSAIQPNSSATATVLLLSSAPVNTDETSTSVNQVVDSHAALATPYQGL